MTEIKKFSKGKHSYTRWGSHFKEVRVEKKKPEKKEEPAPPSLPVKVPDAVFNGVYANTTSVHLSSDEIVLDFSYAGIGQQAAVVQTRVVMSHKHMKQLSDLLLQVRQELEKKS